MGSLINCKDIAIKILKEVKTEVEQIVEATGDAPRLAVILVGNDPASEVYVRNKIRRCELVGIEHETRRLPENVLTGVIKDHIKELNDNPYVHGILVQMPLPKHINADEIINTIRPEKDVDGLHPFNQAQLLNNKHPRLEPCTPAGVMRILKEVHGEDGIEGKSATVLGRSRLFGQPMAQMLVNENATVHICHSKTTKRDRRLAMHNSDFVISAIGKPRYFTHHDFSHYTTVVDVGINRDEDGKLCGDVCTQELVTYLDETQITPVPGGVGIITTAMLMKNTIEAYYIQKGRKK